MPRRGSAVHVVTTTRRYKDKVYATHLLRRSYRENAKVKNETVGNLSHLPDHVIALVRRALQGETFTPIAKTFEITGSRAHGGVQAVLSAMKRLGFDTLLSSRPCRERDLVIAMVAARIIKPHSKLATTRWWHVTTLPEILGVSDATEDDLYDAMDWLLARQERIEKKLSARHLSENGLVLYDLTSSYFEGITCPLAALGHSRDGIKVRPIRHRLEDRVRAHIFLCMLSYYVEWHMLEAWRPLLFADEDQKSKAKRDPVAPAKRSEAALTKVATKRLDDDTVAHSFRTLLEELGGIVRNTCRLPGADHSESATFPVTTTPNPKQAHALALLDTIRV